MNEANSTLAPGPDCIALTRASEGCRLEAYKPIPSDPWTIGYGSTKGVYKGMKISQQEAEDRLYVDLDEAWQGVYSVVDVPLSQGQVDALTDFVFNLGIGNFRKSTLLKKINAGDPTASEEFRKWVYGGGKVLPGLVKRREAEHKLFTGEDA